MGRRSGYAYPWEMDGRYPGPYGTPTVAEGRVYFADTYGMIGCARALDGAILWRFDVLKKLSPGGVDFGYAVTPLVLGGRLYAPALAGDSSATLFCLDAEAGTLIWQAGTSHPTYASCTPVTLGGLLVWWAQRRGPARWLRHSAFAPVWSLTGFTAYYWTSALAILGSAK